jgi:hypothetical protein
LYLENMAKKRAIATGTNDRGIADRVVVPTWPRDRRDSNHTFMRWFIERYRETIRDLSRM